MWSCSELHIPQLTWTTPDLKIGPHFQESENRNNIWDKRPPQKHRLPAAPNWRRQAKLSNVATQRHTLLLLSYEMLKNTILYRESSDAQTTWLTKASNTPAFKREKYDAFCFHLGKLHSIFWNDAINVLSILRCVYASISAFVAVMRASFRICPQVRDSSITSIDSSSHLRTCDALFLLLLRFMCLSSACVERNDNYASRSDIFHGLTPWMLTHSRV